MAIVRWDPFRELMSLREEMDRLFGRSILPERWFGMREWAPACDMHETDKELVVTCELPGLTTKDIDVRVEGDTLIIKGKREFSKEVKEEDYHRVERRYGAFSRYLTLPVEIDANKVKAAFEKGILEIHLPKLAIAKPKGVKVPIEEKTTK